MGAALRKACCLRYRRPHSRKARHGAAQGDVLQAIAIHLDLSEEGGPFGNTGQSPGALIQRRGPWACDRPTGVDRQFTVPPDRLRKPCDRTILKPCGCDAHGRDAGARQRGILAHAAAGIVITARRVCPRRQRGLVMGDVAANQKRLARGDVVGCVKVGKQVN